MVVLSERWWCFYTRHRGASDGHVVLLTERRCCFCEKGYSSSRRRAFFQRGGAGITPRFTIPALPADSYVPHASSSSPGPI